MTLKEQFPMILLVAGSGRNVGKTSLICKIIEKIRHTNRIVAIKLTNHFHATTNNSGEDIVLYQTDGYTIYKEETISTKDSGRFLLSGAEMVLYIEALKQCTKEAFLKALTLIPKDSAIICESGGLSDHTQASGFILVVGNTIKNKSEQDQRLPMADLVFDSSDENVAFDVSAIRFEDGGWNIGVKRDRLK